MSVWRTCSKLVDSIAPKCQFLAYSDNKKSQSFPRRTVLYVPTSDERKLKKIPTLNADTVVLDFEDGVGFNHKETARSNVLEGLKIASSSSSERVVRINGIDSEMLNEDLASIFGNAGSMSHLDALMLPKCESKEHLRQLDFALGFHAGRLIQEPLPLHVIIETPMALNRLPEICKCGTEDLLNLKLESVTMGSDDYLAAIGGQRTESNNGLVYARQSLVATVKAFDLQAIDVVSIDFKDLNALEKECLDGARMGFTGKQLIHPAQIKVARQAFIPTLELVEWAQGLIKLFHEEGKGAIVYRGKMIDRPLLLQAQNIIKMSKS